MSVRSRSLLDSRWRYVSLLIAALLLLLARTSAAQPPSHDPSRMIRNTDGRYWIFTTGNGIWTMSSSNANFTDWRPENTVFAPGTWPSWINQYVSGFGGVFWAPDVIKIGNTFYCYYSCAGQGAPAAIGLATATNLSGPWTDRGLIIAGNNCIDPAPLQDGSSLWMSYGNWQSGIDLIQLNPSNGLRQGSSRWDLIPGQVEAPYIIKNGSYYYLFFQRGLCCQGVNSGYYTQVGRSTSVSSGYVDKNGVTLSSGNGGTTFLPNKDGRYIGPGHVGYGEGKLTFHFYDGNDNGNAKLRITTLTWGGDGWPIADGVNLGGGGGGSIADGTYRLRNRATGRYLDNAGATTNGANVAQYNSSSSNNQRWAVTTTSGFRKLRVLSTSRYLDGMGRTTDGSTCGQWQNSSSQNQQWTIQNVSGSFYRLVNRATGKALDTGGVNTNGAPLQQWFVNASNNQQWEFVP